MTNILVTANILTGCSAVITALTGMHTVAVCYLLPVGVVLYTIFGGIKATFVTDYLHTIVVVTIIFVFAFNQYAVGDGNKLGSPGKVYDILTAAAKTNPIAGNAQGSYLTLKSREGGIFFVINLIGNFGTVFLDNGYYNKAIAASPVHAFPGYVIGGLCWFAIPWLCSTTMGLGAVALQGTHTHLSAADVTAGLALPFAAVNLLGYGGAVATLIIVFMAVTSAFSAQLIAVSSVLTYDIYQAYINPNARGKQLVWVSHMSCILFATAMASFATGLYYAGIGMGYLYLLMGVIISAAVIPGSLSLLWKQQNWIAAAAAPVLGLGVALLAWLVTAKSLYGELTVASTGANYPMLAGNVAALLSPIAFTIVLTYVFGPQNYDYQTMRAIRKVDDSDVAAAAHVDLELIPGEATDPSSDMTVEEEQKLRRAAIYARLLTVFMALSFLIIWPMPMYGSGYVFSKRFFTGWVVVGMIWLFVTAFGVILYPVYDGWEGIAHVVHQMFLDITGNRRRPGKSGLYSYGSDIQDDSGSSPGVATPTEKTGGKC
jgi:SSS family transporter